jgi:maleylacetate reductase
MSLSTQQSEMPGTGSLCYVHEQPRVRIVFRQGGLYQVPAEVERLGWSRVLLIGGQPPQEQVGDELAEALGSLLAQRIVEVQQHVPLEQAQRVTEEARRLQIDGLVALGGGSAIGLAKAVALESAQPIMAVPTTYAGSEMTPIWGRTDSGTKVTGRNERVRPAVVVYDVNLTLGLPAGLTAVSALNALAHCVEASYAADASPVTRLIAQAGAEALSSALPATVEDGGDVSARERLLHGASLAGSALGAASMGVHHAVCHVLGGMFDLPHAETHAVVLPYAVAFNSVAARRRLRELSQALGISPDDYPGALWDLARTLGAPASLTALGLTPRDAEAAAARLSERGPANPRPVDTAGARQLLAAALSGARPAAQSPALVASPTSTAPRYCP